MQSRASAVTWKSVRKARLVSNLDMSLANDVQEVGRVIDALEEFGAENGIAPDQALRFGLALDELITNIISHGFGGRSDCTIRLRIEHDHGVLRAELQDDGLPFDPLTAEIELPEGDIEDRKIGGLGVTLVRKIMDRLDYRREDGFNRLKMEMNLKAA